jgi:hypothetical protein
LLLASRPPAIRRRTRSEDERATRSDHEPFEKTQQQNKIKSIVSKNKYWDEAGGYGDCVGGCGNIKKNNRNDKNSNSNRSVIIIIIIIIDSR